MNPHVTIRWLHASVLALFAAACGASNAEGPVSTTTTTGAPVETPASLAPAESLRQAPPVVVAGGDAASQIASVQCTREDACGGIGASRAFPTFDACVSDVRSAHRQKLTGQLCANGIDPYALSQCIEDVRNQPCGEPGSPPSCARMMLCR